MQITATPKNVKPLLGDTKSHFKFQPNMISSFGAILALSSDDAADEADGDADDYDICKSDPYMSPSYAGDTKKCTNIISCSIKELFHATT